MIRDVQDRTGGFRAFIPYTYQPLNNHLKGRTQATTLEYLRLIAVARLFLHNVNHIQGSWLTTGKEAGQLSLHYGADDLGSVMLEENVVSSAGARHRSNRSELIHLIRTAGRSRRSAAPRTSCSRVHEHPADDPADERVRSAHCVHRADRRRLKSSAMQTLHSAPIVLPVSAAPIGDGAVLVDGDRIAGRRAASGTARGQSRGPGARLVRRPDAGSGERARAPAVHGLRGAELARPAVPRVDRQDGREARHLHRRDVGRVHPPRPAPDAARRDHRRRRHRHRADRRAAADRAQRHRRRVLHRGRVRGRTQLVRFRPRTPPGAPRIRSARAGSSESPRTRPTPSPAPSSRTASPSRGTRDCDCTRMWPSRPRNPSTCSPAPGRSRRA